MTDNASSTELPSDDTIRRAMRLANVNAAIWAVGNGLVSTLLVIYLASGLGAQGLAVSLILAAPRFAGLLRLCVPAMIARLRARKAVCCVAYVLSSLILLIVPTAAWISESRGAAIATLVGAWCLYHLTEYVGTVALWSWLGDLTPREVRGQLLGVRESWLVGGRVGSLALSAGLASASPYFFPPADRWQPLAFSAAIGAGMMLVAVWPLLRMPAVRNAPSAVPTAPWRTLGRALFDPAYRRLLISTCVFSLVNGLTAAAQETFPMRVLQIGYPTRMLFQGITRAGQVVIAPWVGRLVDRIGNRPVMIVSQLIVATGLLFYLAATPEYWWLIGGAFVVWIAYAGLNVGTGKPPCGTKIDQLNARFVPVLYRHGLIF